MKHLRVPLCACGRHHVYRGKTECSVCRTERNAYYNPVSVPCECGQRRATKGRSKCYVCRGRERDHRSAPCVICGDLSTGDTCQPCAGVLRRDERRRRVVQRLYKSGRSFSKIGRLLGISRQRVEQLVRNDARAARQAVHNKLKSGRLEKPERCERCQDTTENLDAHHGDYSQPLDVVWLCRACHNIVHPHYPHIHKREKASV